MPSTAIDFSRYPQIGERVHVLRRWRTGTGRNLAEDYTDDDTTFTGILHQPRGGQRDLLDDNGNVIATLPWVFHTVLNGDVPEMQIVGVLDDGTEGAWLVTSVTPR